jgi:hypothetical protein
VNRVAVDISFSPSGFSALADLCGGSAPLLSSTAAAEQAILHDKELTYQRRARIPLSQEKMEYSNFTVQNGNLVSNKKGMQVSKAKHNGIAFVNASHADIKTGENPASTVSSKTGFERCRPLKIKFVPESSCQDGRRIPKPRTRGLKKHPDTQVVSKPRKDPGTIVKADPISDGRSVGTPSYYSYSSSNSPSAGSEDCIPKLKFDDWHQGSNVHITVLRTLPAWATISLSSHLSEQNKRLLGFAFAEAPLKKYPFDMYGILTYNPLQTNENYLRVVTDPVLTELITAIGVVYHSIRYGTGHSPEIAGLMGQLCSFTNKRVGVSRKDCIFSFTTVECVTIMALLAVSLVDERNSYVYMYTDKHPTGLSWPF